MLRAARWKTISASPTSESHERFIRYRALNEEDPCRDRVDPSGEQIIEDRDPSPRLEEPSHEHRANEPGPARNKDAPTIE